VDLLRFIRPEHSLHPLQHKSVMESRTARVFSRLVRRREVETVACDWKDLTSVQVHCFRLACQTHQPDRVLPPQEFQPVEFQQAA
jgi:hypothetical protein